MSWFHNRSEPEALRPRHENFERMEIEASTMATVDELAGLWVALARDQRAYGSHLKPEANRESVREGLARGIVTGGVLVARAEDGTIAGFVQFSPESEAYAQDVTRGVIENLYVRLGYRGAGIGSELLEAAEEQLFDADADRVRLEVLAANDDARRFYAQHGYTPHRVELEKAPENDNHTKED
jgi:ribosomal protein S18 acetylase RimI-like enzyme